MQIIALSILLMSFCAFGGNTSNKPAEEVDVKTAISCGDANKDAAAAAVCEVESKANSGDATLVTAAAKQLALRCVAASSWGKTLVVDKEGEPTPDFNRALVLPAEQHVALLQFAQIKPFFQTNGYMVMRRLYEVVLEAALPLAKKGEAFRCLKNVLPSEMGALSKLVGEYSDKSCEIRDIFLAIGDMWQEPVAVEAWFSEDAQVPECSAFLKKYSDIRFPFPYPAACQTQMDAAVFVAAGNGADPDKIECECCKKISDKSDQRLGQVTGLFFVWKAFALYHKDKCPNKPIACQKLTNDQRKEALKYGKHVPDATKKPEHFLSYVLSHLDLFATTHADDVDVEARRLSKAWLHALQEIKKCMVAAPALLKDLEDERQEQARYRAVALARHRKDLSPQEQEDAGSGEAKKRKDSDDVATPEE